jgi:hypothetical protein
VRRALLLLVLLAAASAGETKLKHLLDPDHEDFRLQPYAWDEWKNLDRETRLRAKGTDPGAWEEPPPLAETEEEKRKREEEEKKALEDPPQHRRPGFRFDELLKKRQAAFEGLLQPASASKLEGLVKQLDALDSELARFDKGTEELREKFEQVAEQRQKAESVQAENYKKKHGTYPKQVALPVGLVRDFNAASLALQEALARRQAELQFHEWMLDRVGGLIGELTAEEAAKPLKALALGLQDKDWPYRVRCARLLARVEGAGATALLDAAMEKEADPLVLAELLRLRGERGGPDAQAVLERRLDDERWPVRAAAVRALARLKTKDAVDLLVRRMEKEDGRLLDDIAAALRGVTGQRFRSEPDAWKAWWTKARDGWKPPMEATGGDVPAEGQAAGVVYFYGIETRSKRVVFCIDVSGSMGFPLDGEGGKGDPRMVTAKRELVQALGALPEDALFTIVVYNAAVDTWKKRMQPASLANKEAARKFVEKLEPLGATNIFDALMLSMDIAASAKVSDDPEADTILFMTDGQPTNGRITDPHQILDEVTRRNAHLGLVIHVVGVSKEQNRGFLLNLAKQNGGRYVAR